ncbi:MAG: CRISPR-associated endonuclease Cas1 [Gammaproteobacteria bacterium]|nr:CRISPR-associated endonuclease Cas1 [Gammaproteobacteria bacterium]
MTETVPTSLVIDTRKLAQLGMDGPALKVVMKMKSPVLFPLRRLLRIHIIGTPQSGMDALLFCAQQRIPVAFFHADGRLRCRLQAPASDTALVDHWFEHVEFDPEVKQIYADWLLHQGLYALSIMGFHLGAYQTRHKLVYEALRSFCTESLGKQDFRTALDWLDGLLHFQLEQVIAEIGFSQQRGQNKLLNDIKPLAQLWLLHGLANHLQRKPHFAITSQTMITFYQTQTSLIEYSTRRMLIQLTTRLEAIV